MNDFILPENQKNSKGNMRRVGFELEFSHIEIQDILNILKESFGLKEKKINNYYYKLESEYGDFFLELDFELMTKQKLKNSTREFFDKIGIEIDEKDIEDFENYVGELSKDIVPYEISTPPLPLDKLDIIKKLVKKLNENNAYGTSKRFYYAFGLHINVEVISLEVESLLAYLRAYLILQDFLNKDAKIDLTRKITPFIDNFKNDYIIYILRKEYTPTIEEFIRDYLTYNPTRNRSLDMLPILAFINEDLVRENLPEEKIKPRPTFHYRLSNSMIGEADWKVEDEWNRWVKVEKLANDAESMKNLSREYLEYLNNFINFQSWESRIKSWLQKNS